MSGRRSRGAVKLRDWAIQPPAHVICQRPARPAELQRAGPHTYLRHPVDGASTLYGFDAEDLARFKDTDFEQASSLRKCRACQSELASLA